jgi:hypothetical protein
MSASRNMKLRCSARGNHELERIAVGVGVARLHQIRSLACGAAALGCIQSRYTFAFFVDSRNRKSKTIIVL